MVRDTLEAVRPKLKMYTSFEEACKACEDLENEYKPKIGKDLVGSAEYQGPVVQSMVSLTSSLRGQLVKSIMTS